MTAVTNELTVYVYYKIAADNRIASLSAVKNLAQTIQSRYPHLKIQYQKRPTIDAEQNETWMETYAGIKEPQLAQFTTDLAIVAKENGLSTERKCEIFIAL